MTPAIHCLQGFPDDFGDLVFPYTLKSFDARYYFFSRHTAG